MTRQDQIEGAVDLQEHAAFCQGEAMDTVHAMLRASAPHIVVDHAIFWQAEAARYYRLARRLVRELMDPDVAIALGYGLCILGAGAIVGFAIATGV